MSGVLSLDAARIEARALLGQVARGGDPVVERRKTVGDDRDALKAVAERYSAREGGKLRTTAKRRATLERLVYPKMGVWQIDEIKRSNLSTPRT